MQRTVFKAGAACGLLVLLGLASDAAAVDMLEGEWMTMVETTMEGGGMSMPPMSNTMTTCLTKKDLVPDPNQEGSEGCKVLEQKVSGNTVTWRVVCDQDGTKMEGSGEMTYRGASYSGTMRTTSKMEGETMTANMKLSGRHLGPCTGKKAAVAMNPEMEKYKVMADQAMAQSNQEMAKYQAATMAGAEITKLQVPAADPNACRQQGFAAMADCAAKVGALNLQPGRYRLTLEKASSVGTGDATPVDTHEEEVCLSQDDPVPSGIAGAQDAQEVMRGREKVNWTSANAQVEVKGGIVYQGDAFSGVVRETMQAGGMTMHSVTKVTGLRIGDGNCGGGRSYTAQGRSYTSSAPTKPTASGTAEEAVRKGQEMLNPVKGVRNLLGF